MANVVRINWYGLDDPTIQVAITGPVEEAARTIRRRIPVRTGALRRSLRTYFTRTASGPTGIIEATAKHAIFVHEGTGRYGPRGRDIVAPPGRVFAFTGSDGRRVFTRRIKGQRPNRFLTDPLGL
ncbi:HK97 gp10 family phage protein [Desertimonas flava]|uniref:HK97 gp10 family phage protein n=1 Tax=Desertimonas flava TaxID=2064846 RepID=UPI000E34DF88|nr:HK97 gp10 family phage protein [Desertimonas flava]